MADLYHPRYGVPAYVLARSIFPRFSHLRLASRFLPWTTVPSHCGRCHQSPPILSPRFGHWIRSCFWRRRWSCATLRYRITGAGKGSRYSSARHLGCSSGAFVTLALLPQVGQAGYYGNISRSRRAEKTVAESRFRSRRSGQTHDQKGSR